MKKEIRFGNSVTDTCVKYCQKILAQVGNAKASLLAQFRDLAAEHEEALRLAINEAEAMAWKTQYPQLVFQELAAEKMWIAVGGVARQNASPLRLSV